MNIRPKIRNAALVGALAAVAATAWATNESLTNSVYIPAYSSAALVEEPVVVTVPVDESLSPSETVVNTADATIVPVPDSVAAQPPIVVESRRYTEDERIQSVVMDRLASNPNISGKIGVESNGSVVRLSGYTITAGQAYRAGREAGSVVGVKQLQNEIRPRIGGSV